jgi:hypothetical protein
MHYADSTSAREDGGGEQAKPEGGKHIQNTQNIMGNIMGKKWRCLRYSLNVLLNVLLNVSHNVFNIFGGLYGPRQAMPSLPSSDLAFSPPRLNYIYIYMCTHVYMYVYMYEYMCASSCMHI